MPSPRTSTRSLRVLLFLCLLLPALGCASSNQTEERSLSDVVEALREEGVRMQVAGPVSQEVLSAPGQAYTTDGGTMQLYVYRSETSATLDAQQLKGRGQPTGDRSSYFQGGNVIALYFGDAVDVERALSEVIGPRIF